MRQKRHLQYPMWPPDDAVGVKGDNVLFLQIKVRGVWTLETPTSTLLDPIILEKLILK